MMMEGNSFNIVLLRFHFGGQDTVGRITMPSGNRYFTLEPTYRGDNMPKDKIYGKTAIPQGKYRLTPYPSPKHRMTVPLLHDVPGFDMIEIHKGNTCKDTQGCILIGTGAQLTPEQDTKAINTVSNSAAAYSSFYAEFTNLLKQGNVYLQIQNV